MSVFQQELIRSARRLALAARSSPRPWQHRASPIITTEQRLRFLSTQSKVPAEPHIAATTPVFASSHDLIPPSSSQLRTIMIQSALPMIGFGFMDRKFTPWACSILINKDGPCFDILFNLRRGKSSLITFCSFATFVLHRGDYDSRG